MTHCFFKYLPKIVYLIRFSPVNPHTWFPFVCIDLHISWAISELWIFCVWNKFLFQWDIEMCINSVRKKHLYNNISTQIRNYVYSYYTVHQTRQIQVKYGYACTVESFLFLGVNVSVYSQNFPRLWGCYFVCSKFWFVVL